jgi:hypothetical protein
MNILKFISDDPLEYTLRVFLIALIALVLLRVDLFVGERRAQWRVFVASGCNYDTMRMQDRDTRVAMDARQYIPAGSNYSFAQRVNFTPVHINYVMYPDKRSNQWDYFIDSTGHGITPGAGWSSKPLPYGAVLYAKPGKEFLTPAPRPAVYPLGSQLAVFLFMSILEVFAGMAVLSRLGIRPGEGGTLWFKGASYLLGFALLTGLIWLALVLGIRLTAPLIYGVWTAATALLMALAWRPMLHNLRSMVDLDSLAKNMPRRFVGVVATLFGLYILWLVLAQTISSPVLSWDAQWHWILKAKALLYHRTPAFSADTITTEYPLLWPMHAAIQFVLANGAYDEMAQWSTALMLVALVTQMLGAFNFLEVRPGWAWFMIGLFFLCFFHPSLAWAYAEVPMMAYLVGALAALLCFLKRPEARRFAVLGFLMCCGLAMTKLEGSPACLFIAGALALMQDRFPRSRRGWALLVLFSLPVLIELGWLAFQKRHGYLQETHMREPITWAKLQILFASVLDSTGKRGLGWRLFAGMGLMLLLWYRRRWSRQETFIAVIALAMTFFSVAALAGWASRRIETHSDSATIRLMLHVAPLFVLLVGAGLARMNANEETAPGALPETRPEET